MTHTVVGALCLALFVAVTAFGLWRAVRVATQRRALMAELGANGGRAGLYEAWFTRDGVALHYLLGRTGGNRYVRLWTRVEAELPRTYPLEFHVRRAHRGAADFDARFVVEAAPADVVRELIDAPVRDFLMRISASPRLETATNAGGSPVVQLSIAAWVVDAAAAREAIACCVRIASRVREVYARVDAAVPLAPAADAPPFRPALDETARREAAEAREREVAELEAKRRR